MSVQHWVRHGPTHATAMIGWTDRAADLSDRAALARLSAALPDVPVISSDLSRAVATADAIQGTRPRLPHDPRLREIHFGDWEDKRWDEVDEAASRAFWDRPGDTRPPGGESWNALRARVDAAADALAEAHGEVIVVAHMGAILTQVQRGLGIGARAAFGHEIGTLSTTVVGRDPWRVEALSRPA